MPETCGMQFYESRGATWQPLECVEPAGHAGPHHLVEDGEPLDCLLPPKERLTILVVSASTPLPRVLQEAAEASRGR